MLKIIKGRQAKMVLEEDFANLNIVQSDRFHKLNAKVKHEDFNVSELSEDEKFLLTKQILERDTPKKVLIFCSGTEAVNSLAKYLNSNGILSERFHSKQTDNERADSLFKFHTGKTVCLVATDLACRGIDFNEVRLVIQYDYAENAINLLHRIGRTGRFNTSGRGNDCIK